MKNLLFTSCLLVLISNYLTAQNSPIKHKLFISAGVQYIYSEGTELRSMLTNGLDNFRTQYRMEAQYGVAKWLKTGIYLGHTFPDHYLEINNNANTSTLVKSGRRNYILNYGVSASIHPLALLIKKENFRFDLYAAVNLGGNSSFIRNSNNYTQGYSGHYLPFPHERIYLGGFSYYISKNLGLNTEVSLLKHAYKNRRFRIALFYKLGPSKSN